MAQEGATSRCATPVPVRGPILVFILMDALSAAFQDRSKTKLENYLANAQCRRASGALFHTNIHHSPGGPSHVSVNNSASELVGPDGDGTICNNYNTKGNALMLQQNWYTRQTEPAIIPHYKGVPRSVIEGHPEPHR